MMRFETGRPIEDQTLAHRAELPLKPAEATLTGRQVRLEPLDLERDLDALHAVSNGAPSQLGERSIDGYDADSLVWRYMSGGPFASAAELAIFLEAQLEAENGRPFVVVHLPTEQRVGVANFMANMPQHLRIELGNIWYSPLVQRQNVNLEATYLMLSHLFGLGYRRIEWKCDALNERSRRAALRMGFTFEGTQEQHYIVKGRNRDTAWFRMLDRDWPDARSALTRLLDSEVDGL